MTRRERGVQGHIAVARVDCDLFGGNRAAEQPTVEHLGARRRARHDVAHVNLDRLTRAGAHELASENARIRRSAVVVERHRGARECSARTLAAVLLDCRFYALGFELAIIIGIGWPCTGVGFVFLVVRCQSRLFRCSVFLRRRLFFNGQRFAAEIGVSRILFAGIVFQIAFCGLGCLHVAALPGICISCRRFAIVCKRRAQRVRFERHEGEREREQHRHEGGNRPAPRPRRCIFSLLHDFSFPIACISREYKKETDTP